MMMTMMTLQNEPRTHQIRICPLPDEQACMCSPGICTLSQRLPLSKSRTIPCSAGAWYDAKYMVLLLFVDYRGFVYVSI